MSNRLKKKAQTLLSMFVEIKGLEVEHEGALVTTFFGESKWRESHLTVRKWESEKHRRWSMPVERCRNHVTTDGSLLGVSGRWSACGWLVVQQDYDQNMWPMHGMDAELEVQRTITSAEFTAFLCLFRRIIGPTTAHVDNKGIIDGLLETRNEVHWPESEGRRCVNFDLGGGV